MIMYIIHICFRRPHPNTLPRAQYQNHFGGKKKCTQSAIKSLYVHGIKSRLLWLCFQKEWCTYPSRTTCYDILAAKNSIGIEIKTPSIVIGTSQLRRKARSRAENWSGRKIPRRGDSEVGPVLDDLGKLRPMENQPKQNRKEKVSKGRESVLVNSLIVRIHHAVPITLTRPRKVKRNMKMSSKK